MNAASRTSSSSAGPNDLDAFVNALSDQDKMLVRLREELYEGSWEGMLADLNDRLHGRPYIFRLASRLQDDLERVRRLSRFERQHGVNLAKLLWPDEYK